MSDVQELVTDPTLPGYLCTICGKRRDKHLGQLLCVQHEGSALAELTTGYAAEQKGDAVRADWCLRRANVYATLALAQEVRRLEATATAMAREFWVNGGRQSNGRAA